MHARENDFRGQFLKRSTRKNKPIFTCGPLKGPHATIILRAPRAKIPFLLRHFPLSTTSKILSYRLHLLVVILFLLSLSGLFSPQAWGTVMGARRPAVAGNKGERQAHGGLRWPTAARSGGGQRIRAHNPVEVPLARPA